MSKFELDESFPGGAVSRPRRAFYPIYLEDKTCRAHSGIDKCRGEKWGTGRRGFPPPGHPAPQYSLYRIRRR